MTEITLEFIGQAIMSLQGDVRDVGTDLRDVRQDVHQVRRELAQLRDEHTVNTAWLMREKAEPIAAAALQSQLQRMNARLDAMESRVGAVETRLPAE